ncbi:hypothetical protein [uncultured Luteimonas sp.]|uniref:hypothetical protein n=1 Tax=uncultured Luteimonas sp. TaxID=453144 RepID=UPI00260ECFED|nr:hypothetical protein [uncultured Luteimonas sp.]
MRLPATRISAVLLGAVLASGVAAQDAPPASTAAAQEEIAGTGNAWIDLRLDDMDRYAARYREAFVDEIVRYLEAPRPLVDEALSDGRMRPGEVYYACALARASGRPCRSLVDARLAGADGGWAGILARLELDDEARLHARIREDIVASYRRWARPIDIKARPAR